MKILFMGDSITDAGRNTERGSGVSMGQDTLFSSMQGSAFFIPASLSSLTTVSAETALLTYTLALNAMSGIMSRM